VHRGCRRRAVQRGHQLVLARRRQNKLRRKADASAGCLQLWRCVVAHHSTWGRSTASSCSIQQRHMMTTGPFPPPPSPVAQTISCNHQRHSHLAPGSKHRCPMLTRARSICVAIASSSKFLRQQLSNAMVDFSTPLRIVDHTAPDEDFPELIKFDEVARGHNADGGAGSALLVKGLVAVRALRDFCCNHSKGGEIVTLRACAPFVGGVLRRAEAKFHAGINAALMWCANLRTVT